MFFGASNMSLMAFFAKVMREETPHIGIFQIAMFRALFLILGSSLQALCNGTNITKVTKKVALLLFLRGLGGYISFLCQLVSIFLLPLSLSTVLYFT